MEMIALVVRLLLAATFMVAAIAKFSNLTRTREGIRDFGVPDLAVVPLGFVLPFVELVVAVLLLPQSTARWGSLGAIALLLCFIVAIGINLALGRKPECNCFGQLHSTPIGWQTLVRNGILVAGAGLVAWQSYRSVPVGLADALAGLGISKTGAMLLGAVALLIVMQGWLNFHLLRQNGRLLLRMDALEATPGNAVVAPALNPSAPGLTLGETAPTFRLSDVLDGPAVSLGMLLAEQKPVVLIFSDPNCGPCSALLPDIVRWEQKYASTLTMVLISRGTAEANRKKLDGHPLKHVLLQKDREIAAVYMVNGTPGAVLISREGTIASTVAMGAAAITSLVTTSSGNGRAAIALPNGNLSKGLGTPEVLTGLKLGEAAPPLNLPDLNGDLIDLSELRDQETLVLFWNPTCGFCSKMLPDLKVWEASRSVEDEPKLLIVSSGTLEASAAMGLSSPVVLDPSFATAASFHLRGTPSAVLVGANGRIASPPGVGASAVFALANQQRVARLTAAGR